MGFVQPGMAMRNHAAWMMGRTDLGGMWSSERGRSVYRDAPKAKNYEINTIFKCQKTFCVSIDTYLFMLLISFPQLVACIDERETRDQRLSVHVCVCIYLSTPACLWSAANSSISDSRERSASVISADSSKTNGDIFPNMNFWLTLFKIWSGFMKLS